VDSWNHFSNDLFWLNSHAGYHEYNSRFGEQEFIDECGMGGHGLFHLSHESENAMQMPVLTKTLANMLEDITPNQHWPCSSWTLKVPQARSCSSSESQLGTSIQSCNCD
jgi:hypothetical protein